MTDNPNFDGRSPSDDATDDATDARIDAMARSAGREVRRPAPERGVAGVERARRRRQLARVGGGGAAIVVLLVAGALVLDSRRDDDSIITSDSIVDTTVVTTSAPTVPTTTEPAPTTLPPADAPTMVFAASGSFADIDRVQSLIDPTTGQVLGTEPMDEERAAFAQLALSSGDRSTVDLGDVAYDFLPVTFDAGTLATEFFPDVDLCSQNVVSVRSPAGSALPERARYLIVSADDRSVVTVSSDCPEAGTMGADGVGTQLPYDIEVRLFDAQRPELPGVTLAVLPSTDNPSAITSSGNGRFVAVETFAEAFRYRVFDLETFAEVDLGIACPYVGATYSRFIGPWVGASSIALNVQCPDESRLIVRDLVPGATELQVVSPNQVERGFLSVEVDHQHYSTPRDAWFTMCDFSETTCWIGHGDEPLIEVAEVNEASFLPLGYYPGG